MEINGTQASHNRLFAYHAVVRTAGYSGGTSCCPKSIQPMLNLNQAVLTWRRYGRSAGTWAVVDGPSGVVAFTKPRYGGMVNLEVPGNVGHTDSATKHSYCLISSMRWEWGHFNSVDFKPFFVSPNTLQQTDHKIMYAKSFDHMTRSVRAEYIHVGINNEQMYISL